MFFYGKMIYNYNSSKGGVFMSFVVSNQNLIRKVRHLFRTFEASQNSNKNTVALLNEMFSSFEKDLKQIIEVLDSQIDSKTTDIFDIKSEYSKKINLYKNQFVESLERITKHHRDEIDKIKAENDDFINSRKHDLVILESENETIKSSFNQKDEYLTIQKNEKLDNLKYLVSFPLKNYSLFISEKTDALESLNEATHAQSSKRLFTFDESNKTLIESYNSQLTLNQKNVETLAKKGVDTANKIREIINKQNIRLNDRINALSNHKNVSVQTFKKEYDEKILDLSHAIQTIKNIYSQSNRVLLKQFANKLTEIDGLIDKETSNYDLQKAKIINEFNTALEQISRSFGTVNTKYREQIHKLASENTDVLQSELKSELRKAKAEYYRAVSLLYRETKEQIIELNKNLLPKLENLKSSKFLAEINKNYDIHSSSIKEANDQENNNIKEALVNKKYEVLSQNENKNLAISVNNLKSNNEIRLKIYEKDLLSVDYTNKIMLEDFLYEANQLTIDREYAKEIEKLVHDKADYILEKTMSLNNILSLLEIEKTKKLKDFNIRNYENLVNKAEIEYDYSRNLDYQERDFYLNINQINTDKINHEISYKKETSAFSITRSMNAEEHLHAKEKQLFIKKNGQEKYKLYTQRFNKEFEIMKASYNGLTNLFKLFDVFEQNILERINYDVSLNAITENTAITLDISFFEIGEQYTNDLVDEFLEMVISLIKRRISFETGFKFDSMFGDLDETFNTSTAKIEEEKKAILDALNDYEIQIQNLIQKDFSLENDAVILSKEIENQSKATNITILNKRLEQIRIQRNETAHSRAQLEKMKRALNKDLAAIPKKQAILKENYTIQYNKINHDQRKESRVYYDTITLIQSRFNEYKNHYLKLKITSENTSSINLNTLNSYLQKYIKERRFLRYIIEESFARNSLKIVKRINNEHDKMLTKYLSNYSSNLAIAENEFNKKESERLAKVVASQSKHKKALEAIDNNLTKEKNDNNSAVMNIKAIYAKKNEENALEKKQNYETLYSEVEGVNANMENLKKKYQIDIKKYNTNYTNTFSTLSKKNQAKRELEQKKCKAQKKLYSIEIENKVISTKYESKNIRHDNKVENNLLHLEIKANKEALLSQEKNINNDIHKADHLASLKLKLLEKNRKKELAQLEQKTRLITKNVMKQSLKNTTITLKNAIKNANLSINE